MKSTTGGDRTAGARTAAGSISVAPAVTTIIVIVRATTVGVRPGGEWVSRPSEHARDWRSATHQQQR
jgi:hypothetical protein